MGAVRKRSFIAATRLADAWPEIANWMNQQSKKSNGNAWHRREWKEAGRQTDIDWDVGVLAALESEGGDLLGVLTRIGRGTYRSELGLCVGRCLIMKGVGDTCRFIPNTFRTTVVLTFHCTSTGFCDANLSHQAVILSRSPHLFSTRTHLRRLELRVHLSYFFCLYSCS
jgi:hypothetical protein